MGRLTEGLHALAVAAWAGALWSIGLLALPAVQARVADAAVAAAIDARLLLYVALIGLGCGVFLLLLRLARFGAGAFRHGFFWVVVLLLILTALTQFGQHALLELARGQAAVRDVLEALFRDRSAIWAGVPSLAYSVQCGLAVALVLLQPGAPR